jgi:HPt (histidine-containing phosphotransfer) domain-containing protein
MSQLLDDHFVREAGEYLAELERLLAERSVPDSERVFRLARGIRGSAQVARADEIAEVAARLEGAARFILEGRIPWSPEIRDRFAQTVDDLRVLVPAVVQGWGAREDVRVEQALARWGGFEDVVRTPPTLAPGEPVFSFVRSELSGVVAALDRAVAELEESPAAEQPPRTVLERLRVIRGLSGADPLAPVLEVVDGLDELLRTLITDRLPADGERLQLLAAGRDALRAALRDLERDTQPSTTGAVFEQFRGLRARLLPEPGSDTDVVPISALFYDDAGPHILSSGPAPAPAVPAPPPAAAEQDEPVVPIESLLLRGSRALEAALALRPEVERLVAESGGSDGALRERLEEIWDLVELGRSGVDA